MIEQRIRARVGAYSVPAVVHAVQGDTGRVFVFELEDYTITGAEGASLNCQRPDKSFYTYAGTVSAEDNTVTVALDVEGGALTQEGVVTFQLELTEDGLIVCTFRGSIIVEPVVGGEATQEEKDFRDAIQAQLNDKASNAQLAQVESDLTDSIDAVADDIAQEILDREAADATKANKSTTINGKSLEADRVIYAQDIPSKNLLPNTASTQTINGVTFTVNADGSVTVNGTATASTSLNLYEFSGSELQALEGCVLTGCPSGGGQSVYNITLQGSNSPWTTYARDNGDGAVIASGNVTAKAFIFVYSGQTVNNLTFRPMIRLASITDDSYVPYAKTNVELSKIESGTITLASGWTISSDTSAQLYKTNRLVTFNLSAYPTSQNLSLGWNTVWTLPQGFRPSGIVTFNAVLYGSGNAFLKSERVQLKNDGTLQVYSQTARSDVVRVVIFGTYISE